MRNNHPLSRSSTQPLLPTDLNPQPLKKGNGIQYLAESSKSRRARQKAVGMVNKIGRALSITKPKEKLAVPEIPPSNRASSYSHGPQYPKPNPIKPNFTGPIITPLKSGDESGRLVRTAERLQRGSRPSVPLRSRQSWHTESVLTNRTSLPTHSASTNTEPLYNSQWNHSSQALSLFDVPAPTTPKVVLKSDHLDTSDYLDLNRSQRREKSGTELNPRLSSSVLGERQLNHNYDDYHNDNIPDLRLTIPVGYSIGSTRNAKEIQDSPKRPLSTPPPNQVTPKGQNRRKPIPIDYVNESFESLVNSIATKTINTVDKWQPLNITHRSRSPMFDRGVIHGQASGLIETPPTPNFGTFPAMDSPAPSPSPSLDESSSIRQGWDKPHCNNQLLSDDSALLDSGPETSFERGQDILYDEVLTSWNLPPLAISRSCSLVLDMIGTSTYQPIKEERNRLSKSTGLLETKSRLNAGVTPTPSFYPSGRSFEPIRSSRSSDMLNSAGSDKEKKDRNLVGEGKRRLSGRVKSAVEALEGRRNPSESPPTPWKEMAKLLQPRKSSSSLDLQDETRRMMSEVREKRSKSRPIK